MPPVSGAGTTPRPYWDRAFLQFAGFAVGRSIRLLRVGSSKGAVGYLLTIPKFRDILNRRRA